MLLVPDERCQDNKTYLVPGTSIDFTVMGGNRSTGPPLAA